MLLDSMKKPKRPPDYLDDPIFSLDHHSYHGIIRDAMRRTYHSPVRRINPASIDMIKLNEAIKEAQLRSSRRRYA